MFDFEPNELTFKMSMNNYQGFNDPLEDLVDELTTSDDEYPAPNQNIF